VHVLGYLPLSLVLPRCAAVISHAGFSTLCTTLLNGLPSVLIPLGADQPENAEASARLGVARVVAPREYTPGEIRSAVRAVLAESTYRERAESIRTAMLELPGPARAVELLEQLARDKQPLASEQPRASEAAA
jgi:UDP:flavonoid glycosyltransferase YjiC (YdhE family)